MLLQDEVRQLALEATAASGPLGRTAPEARDGALAAMAQALRDKAAAIMTANQADMEAAREAGTSEAILDRLMLDEGRIEAMAAALEDLMALPDPLGHVQERRTMYNGIELTRVSVPLGVVAVAHSPPWASHVMVEAP